MCPESMPHELMHCQYLRAVGQASTLEPSLRPTAWSKAAVRGATVRCGVRSALGSVSECAESVAGDCVAHAVAQIGLNPPLVDLAARKRAILQHELEGVEHIVAARKRAVPAERAKERGEARGRGTG